RDLRAGLIAREHRANRREIAAGAVARDDDRHAQLRRYLAAPQQRVVAILDRRGVGMLGRETILDENHAGPGLLDHEACDDFALIDAADHPAAAVIEDDKRAGRGFGQQNAPAYLANARCDLDVLDLADLGTLAEQRRARSHEFARFLGRGLRDAFPARRLHRVEHLFDDRMQRHWRLPRPRGSARSARPPRRSAHRAAYGPRL